MEQHHSLVTRLEAEALSKITPEEAYDILLFMRKLPEPSKIDPSISVEDSNYLDDVMTKIRCFLVNRSGLGEVKNERQYS